TTGRALDFQHHNNDAGSDWGTIVIGSVVGPNIFNSALPQYIRLQFENGVSPFFDAPTFVAGGTPPPPGDFDVDLNGQHNIFAGVPPAFMTALQLANLETKVFHKVDDVRVGLVDFGFNYLPTLSAGTLAAATNE